MTTPPLSDERLPIYTSNTFEIPGLELEQHLGLCWGLTVVSLGFGRSFTGGFRALAAGEVPEFTQAVDEARRGALFRMVEHAKALAATPWSACGSTRTASARARDWPSSWPTAPRSSSRPGDVRGAARRPPLQVLGALRPAYRGVAPCASQNRVNAFCVLASQMKPPMSGRMIHKPVIPLTGFSCPSASYSFPTSDDMRNGFTKPRKMARIRPTTPPMPFPL